MNSMRILDNMKDDLEEGEYKKVKLQGDLWVIGKTIICPCNSDKEADKMIKEMSK